MEAFKVTLEVAPTVTPPGIPVVAGKDSASFDVNVDGQNSGALVKVELFIGKKLTDVKMYHNVTELKKRQSKVDFVDDDREWFYDDATGIVTFVSDEFSSFTAVYDNIFAGGSGTEDDPYLIATKEQFANINNLTGMKNGVPYWFEQTANLEVNTTINFISGGYDGGGYTISSNVLPARENYNKLFFRSTGHVIIENMNVKMDEVATVVLFRTDLGTAYGADFKNIDFGYKADSEGETIIVDNTNIGLVTTNVIWTVGADEVEYNFEGITNNVDITNKGTYTGFIIGSGPHPKVKTTFNFKNCINYGNITGTTYVGYLYGNPDFLDDVSATDSKITVDNCVNNGTFKATGSCCEFAPKLDFSPSATGTGEFISGANN